MQNSASQLSTVDLSIFLATEQDEEFLRHITIHCLISIVFADFESFDQMQNFCMSAQCSGFE